MICRVPTAHLLTPGSVHIWQIDLSLPETLLEACCRILSPDESARAARFYFQSDQIRYIAGRVAMRVILSQYLDIVPEEITFSYGARGKPELAPVWNHSGLMFNLSHSRGRALLGATLYANIGVDIEFINPNFMAHEVANRFFSAGEVNTLQALDSEKQRAAFFSCWTRKEAYIKALGEGLFLPLDSFAVAFGENVAPGLLRVDACPAETDRWRVYNIDACDQYAAALVIEGTEHILERREWIWAE